MSTYYTHIYGYTVQCTLSISISSNVTIGASFAMQELGARGGRAEALLPVRQVAREPIERAGLRRHTQLRGGLSGLSRLHSQAALRRAAGLQSARALLRSS